MHRGVSHIPQSPVSGAGASLMAQHSSLGAPRGRAASQALNTQTPPLSLILGFDRASPPPFRQGPVVIIPAALFLAGTWTHPWSSCPEPHFVHLWNGVHSSGGRRRR